MLISAAVVLYLGGQAATPVAVAGQTPAAAPARPAAGDEAFAREVARASELLAENPKAAIKAFTKLQASRSGVCLECLLGIAAGRNRTGQHMEAERVAREILAVTDHPQAEALAYNLLGVSFYDRTPVDGSDAELARNMTEAEAAFREAHRLDQGKTESIRWNLASALEWLGRPEAKDLFSDPSVPTFNPSDRPQTISGEVQKPVVLVRVQPEYTDRARYKRAEGLVVLRTIIDTNGNVVYVKVEQALRGCTQEAIESVRQWKFEPATLDGVPVPVFFTLTVNFQLR